MLAAWMAGVSLAFGVSWLTIVDRIGAGIWNCIAWIKARRSVARDVAVGVEAKKARVEAAKVEVQRSATRVKPRIEAPAPVVEKSERVEKERQVPMFDAPKSGELPPLKLLDDPAARESGYSSEALEAMSRLVELKLKDFGVEVEVVAVQPGPVVTRFEMRPAPGVKVSQISGLAKDLARSLSAISVRVVEVIPGKSVMGLEIPNEKREIVTLGEIIKSKSYDDVASPLALALGKDIGGAPVTADLAKMPHLLVAGTTGSGKSVAINAMILSLLYKSTAEHVRLIMIDPKMLELSVYEGIPHLLAPVVTDMKHAANALRWCVAEMERRYQLMAALGVRNIAGYNRKVKDANDAGKPIRDPVMTAMAANDPDARPVEDPRPHDAAVHRRDHRRARRHDDDRRQEGGRADRAARAEGARLGHPSRCSRPSVPSVTSSPASSRRTSRRASRSRCRRGSTRARFSTRWAPNRCSVTATCSIYPRAPRCRRACTALSSATPRCIAWSRRSRRAGRQTTSKTCSKAPACRSPESRASRRQKAVVAMAANRMRCTTKP
jgi:hypothetical protein